MFKSPYGHWNIGSCHLKIELSLLSFLTCISWFLLLAFLLIIKLTSVSKRLKSEDPILSLTLNEMFSVWMDHSIHLFPLLFSPPPFFLFFLRYNLCSPGCNGTHYVDWAGLITHRDLHDSIPCPTHSCFSTLTSHESYCNQYSLQK